VYLLRIERTETVENLLKKKKKKKRVYDPKSFIVISPQTGFRVSTSA